MDPSQFEVLNTDALANFSEGGTDLEGKLSRPQDNIRDSFFEMIFFVNLTFYNNAFISMEIFE